MGRASCIALMLTLRAQQRPLWRTHRVHTASCTSGTCDSSTILRKCKTGARWLKNKWAARRAIHTVGSDSSTPVSAGNHTSHIDQLYISMCTNTQYRWGRLRCAVHTVRWCSIALVTDVAPYTSAVKVYPAGRPATHRTTLTDNRVRRVLTTPRKRAVDERTALAES